MPLMKPDLDFVFGLKAQLGEMVVIGESPEGLRRMIPIVDGTFDGPNVRGQVLGGGADWQYVRSDGVTIAEAVYLLQGERRHADPDPQSRRSSRPRRGDPATDRGRARGSVGILFSCLADLPRLARARTIGSTRACSWQRARGTRARSSVVLSRDLMRTFSGGSRRKPRPPR